MRSLRARLIAGLLALAAVGLLVLAGVTYAEQRRFLYERVDQQARAAPFAVAVALSGSGFAPRDGDGPRRRQPRRRPPAAGRRTRRPAARGHLRPAARPGRHRRGRHRPRLRRREGRRARPTLPADRARSASCSPSTATDGDTTRYRVYAAATTGRAARVVAAVPLREVDRTLNQLLLVMGARDRRRARDPRRASRWMVVRIGLLPLDRMGHTAGAIAGGDLSHRIEATDPRTEVGRLGHRAERDARPARARVRRARGQRGAPAPVPGRRVARAAHAAGIDPRLRGAVPHRRGARARGHVEGDAAHRGGGGSAWACSSRTC